MEIRPIEKVVAVDLRRRDARNIGEVERPFVREPLYGSNLGLGEGAVLDQQGGRFETPDQRQATAGAGNPRTAESLDRGGEQLEAVPGRQFQPPGDGDKAPGGEPGEKTFHGLEGVKVARVERLEPGAGGPEGVHQRNLNEVVSLVPRGGEPPRLGNVDADFPAVIGPAREPGMVLFQKLHHLGIDLDGIDSPGLVKDRHQDVAAAA